MNILDRIISVQEASELWELSPGTIKNMCAEGHIRAKKIGRTWVIDSQQVNPVRRPERVEYGRKTAPPEGQIDLFETDAPPAPSEPSEETDERTLEKTSPASAPDAPPSPDVWDDEDADYFADLWGSFLDGGSEEDATERLKKVLSVYAYHSDDAARLIEFIKEKKGSDDRDDERPEE